ncbi:MAG TPA: glycosyltransferase, partial [Armatimonadota bacterium]
MKFCVIGPVYPFRGGIAQHTTLLCRHLADKHEVEAVSFKRLYPAFLFPGKTQMDQSKEAVSFNSVPLIDSIDPLTWTRAGRYIKEKAPDVVVVEWWHPFFAPCLASVLRHSGSTRAIFVCHNVLPHEPKPFIRPLTMHALRNGYGFVVHAKQEEEILRCILPNAKVARTPLPSLDVFPRQGLSREEARKSLDIQGPTILFFGLIRKYKGLIDLIRAVGLMKDRELTCIIAGEFYENK